ncbi:044R [Invertebrate iridescent virus 6]|uniref:Uncharacterized protein 044R n=1 Tax=Invertebrate iridescent virus 6 TaxID=176652 RepID=044R_IIV6|nr:044R [Invertebrate iridescent virus 6]Q91G54.1 RecName: Full=Uncharacterized protein 044R [Invertebrate iridescent virus 6]AAK81978.1 044R [Invertebrate iridescent virus 6]QMS79368.1 hypothetical protein IIV6-T1_048 [Invertebrate iridescent virus 6]
MYLYQKIKNCLLLTMYQKKNKSHMYDILQSYLYYQKPIPKNLYSHPKKNLYLNIHHYKNINKDLM